MNEPDGGDIATRHGAGMGDDGVDIRLDDIERRVEIAAFLASLASVNLIVWAIVLVVAAIMPGDNPARLYLLTSAPAAIWFFFLWSWSIAQLWRAPILLGALVVGGSLAIVPLAQLLKLKAELGWPMQAMFVVLALVSAGFGLRVVLDGWRLARTAEATCRLLTSVPYDRFAAAQACARALGIHPICRWLPKRRRVATTLLFVLTAVALTLALGGALYGVVKVVSTELPAAFQLCILYHSGERPAGFTQCIVAASVTIGPLIMIALGLAVAATIRLLARRSARLSLADVSSTDARAPILFLRSFIDDQVELALPRRPLFRRILALGDSRPRLDHVLLEEATPIGPVVAIGLPGSPPPFGAARAYFHDTEWRSAVAELASQAKAIVVVADDTQGVQWELGHIRERGFAGKTLYLLPPRLSTPSEATRLIEREIAVTDAIGSTPVIAAGRTCIGWYQSAAGRVRILSTARPASTSYVCALRLAFGPWSDHAMAHTSTGHDAREGERPELDEPVRVQPRTRSRLVGIAVVLAMLLPIPALTGVNLFRSRGMARAAMARAQIVALTTAIEQYSFELGDYPSQDIGLRALVEAPPGAAGWRGPYVAGDTRFLDPWGRPYIYRKPGRSGPYDLLSLGRDGEPGGTGEDADVTIGSR